MPRARVAWTTAASSPTSVADATSAFAASRSNMSVVAAALPAVEVDERDARTRRRRAGGRGRSRRVRHARGGAGPRRSTAASTTCSSASGSSVAAGARPITSSSASSAADGPAIPTVVTPGTRTPARWASRRHNASCSTCCRRVTIKDEPDSLYAMNRHALASNRVSAASRPSTRTCSTRPSLTSACTSVAPTG